MNKTKRFLLVFISLFFVFILASCDENVTKNNSNTSVSINNETSQSNTKEDKYYTITWKNYDGEIIKTETVKYGTNPIYNGDTPVRPSDQENRYVFLKWDKFFSPVTSDAEYTAVFMAIPYSNCLVKFDSKGGSEVTPQNIIKGEKVTKPSNPTKEGYTFDDWYYQGEKWSFIGYTVTDDMTLEAKWTINSYTLKLSNSNSMEGKISNNSGSFEFNEAVTITATANDGYTFDGWYDGDNQVSTQSTYTFNMPAKNITYTAKWNYKGNSSTYVEVKVHEHNITVNKNIPLAGQVNIRNNSRVDNGAHITLSTNYGYGYYGLFSDDKLVSNDSDYYFVINDDISFNAKWYINRYEINLNDDFVEPTFDNLDNITISSKTYKYAKDSITYSDVQTINTSIGGTYEITLNVVNSNNESTTIIYYLYVNDSNSTIDFVNGESAKYLTAEGFAIDGVVTAKYGYVAAIVRDTEETITLQDIINDDNTQYFEISNFNVHSSFIADNINIKSGNKQYYVYYTVLNSNKSNLSSATVYSFDVDVIKVSTKEEFNELARKNTINGETHNITTIFVLQNDLDFESYSWNSYGDLVKEFSGLFNGKGHTIKNINITTEERSTSDYLNVFYSIDKGSLMNVNFNNINLLDTANILAKRVGIVGTMNCGSLYNIKMENINIKALESIGALVGWINGGYNYISRCQLVNDTNSTIYALNKYVGGIVGNVQIANGQELVQLFIDNCSVVAKLGAYNADETRTVDAGGNIGGILGRMKNDNNAYLLKISNCFYTGTLIGQNYKGGIVGDFDNGLGKVYLNNNISIPTIVFYKPKTVDDDVTTYEKVIIIGKALYDNGEDDVSEHKNNNPIVGRAILGENGLYETSSNIGSFNDYYYVINSESIYFTLVSNNEPYKFILDELQNTYGFDLAIWNINLDNNPEIIMTLK